MKNFNFKTLLLAIGLVVASTQPAWAWYLQGNVPGLSWNSVTNAGTSWTAKDVSAGQYYFKMSKNNNNDWSGGSCWIGSDPAEGCSNHGTESGDNAAMWFTIDKTSDITFTFPEDWKVRVSATPSKRYLTGSFWGSTWSADGHEMEWNATDKCYSLTVTNLSQATYSFRITKGDWNDPKIGWNEYNTQQCHSGNITSVANANKDNNIDLTISKNSDVTIKYYPTQNSEKICITATDPINGIAGTFNSWNATTNPLVYSGDVAQTTIALTSGTTYKFKVRVNSDWRGNNGTMNRKNCTDWDMSTNVGDECGITADLSGNYIFIYNKSTGKLTVKYPSTLTLDGHGGEPASQNLTLYIGDEMSSTKFTQPQKTGYDYKGFTTAKDGSTNLINQDGTFASSTTYTNSKKWSYVNGTGTTAYAKWDPHTYTISYKDQGGGDYSGTKSGLVTSHTYESATELVAGSGKKGYAFMGWYTDSECTEGPLTSLGATAFSADITLYAKWQANTTAITINKNDGTDGTVSVTAVYDGAISAVTGLTDALRTRSGYTFSEINTTASGSGTTIITWTGSAWAFAANAGTGKYTDNTPVWKYTENTELTLNTRWTANPYTVSFYDADDAASPSQTLNVTYDAEIGSSSVTKPTKSGYIFGGYFTGKGGTGTQLTDANGNLLEVAGYFEKTGTKLYWKNAGNVSVYAAWSEEKTCSLTFGITDGAQATNERGSLSITFNENEYKVGGLTGSNPSIATIDNIPSGTTLTINFAHRSGSGVNATTPESWWTTATKTSSAPVTLVSAGIYSFTITDDASIYLWSTLNQYEFAHAVNPAAGGAITTDNDTYIAGPAVQRVLTATPNDGYEFSSWTLSENVVKSGSQTETTNPLTITLKNSSNESVTANFTAITYDITYNNVAPSEHTNPATYTVETATITLQDASRENYTFDGWFDAETDGNKVTQITVGSTGNITLWARWHETTYLISTSMGTGIQSIDPTSQQVGNVTEKTFTATVKTGYTWTNWTLPAGVTGTATNNPISVKATAAGTITANATENMTTVSVGVNDVNMGSVNMNSVSVGVATTATLTATNKPGYKFKMWTLTGGARLHVGSNLNNATIVIEGDGTSASGTATAEFEEDLSTGVYLKGEGNFGGWDVAGFEFMKPTGQSTGNDAYVTITTTTFEAFWQVPFAVFDHGTTMVSSNYFFFNSTLEATLTQAPQAYENMKFFSTVAGDYVFHYNLSTKKLSIEYPHENCVAVSHSDNSWTIYPLVNNEATINLDGSKSYKFCVIYDGAMYANLQNITDSQKELKLYNNYESFNNKIWINTVKGGNYVFNFDHSNDDHLTVTYPEETFQTVTVYEDGITPKEVKVYEVSKPSITAQVPEGMNFNGWVTSGGAEVANTSATTTTVTNAGTNGTVKATFNTNKRIYLKGGSNFNDAYINFYKEAYWDANLGSGNTGQQCVSKSNHMNKVTNTDIFWYDLNNNTSGWNNYFTFVNKGGDYNNFSMCNVVYRNDMKDALPFYVPRNGYASEHHNTSQYFNEGIWMKYNSTESGYDIRGFGNWEDKTHRFVAATPGGYEFKTTLTLAAGTTYQFKIFNDNGTDYGASGQTMTATSCTNWKMHLNNNNCQITTSEAGEYTFVLNLGSGEVIVSVEYPLSNDDYRVVAKESSEVKWEGDLIKNSKNVAKKDTTSFFNNNYTYQLQQYAGGGTWNDVASQTVTITDENAKVGVINLIVTQDESGNATLAYEGVYTGNYYIRTDGVDGGWGSYKSNPDNKMDNYGSLLVADPGYQYDVYKAKWITAGKNVKFRIANDYSKAISDELKGDAIIDNKETLPQDANVRFMWNSKTNLLKRAYISGSTDTKDRYLVLTGDEKMFDEGGNVIPAGTADNHREGLLANELNFADKNNWVYQADIKAQPGCAVKLTAAYNSKVQYFIGAEGEKTGSRKTIISGNGTDKYIMRVVYDFKTNLLIAGWVPSDTIKSNIALGGDMLITRTHQDSAQQIIFGGDVSISDIHHVYGVLTIKKDTMLGKGAEGAKYTTVATNDDYSRTMYWISFPFKVKISEIFGVDGYGQKWIMQKYRGDLRAQKGWFKEDTPTFWEFMEKSDSLNAYEGYLFLIDANYFNTTDADVWKNSATEANFYFPSASGNIGIINKSEYTQSVPAHVCGIDRWFSIGKDNSGNDILVNHQNTDSYWNVIGVPAFQNKSMALSTTEVSTDMKAIYEWNSAYNTYTPHALADEFRFQTMHAYMVQFGGDITWSDVSVVNNPTPAQGGAPRYAYADEKNYMVELFFNGNGAEDHTYINLADEASTDFVLNEDMMKIDNAGFPNIYSFAGNYNVAYNETKKDNQTVMLGVSAPKDGNYTFAMPKDFSGTAKLIDLVEGITTDLNVANYSVDLNKGTYNNRFQLVLEVEAKTPTSMENVECGLWNVDGKTTKILRNGEIYLINGGRVYNVLGVEE